MNTAVGETMKKMIQQVDKALKTLNLPIGDKFMIRFLLLIYRYLSSETRKNTFSAYNSNCVLTILLTTSVTI